jgi:hypothetical protein
MKMYRLLGPAGPYESATPGQLGGNRRLRIYGRLDCSSANRALAKGYKAIRVFFADEATAKACGFRPCGTCLPVAYRSWRAANVPAASGAPGSAPEIKA